MMRGYTQEYDEGDGTEAEPSSSGLGGILGALKGVIQKQQQEEEDDPVTADQVRETKGMIAKSILNAYLAKPHANPSDKGKSVIQLDENNITHLVQKYKREVARVMEHHPAFQNRSQEDTNGH